MSVCSEPGCPSLSEQTYCTKHTKQKRKASARRRSGSPEQRAYKGTGALGRAWRKARAEYLRLYPMCECGCGRSSEQVHHRDGRGVTGPRGLDITNFQALARACHSRITAQEQPGGWHS